MSKKEQLEKLDQLMSACSKCALRENCSRVVFGEGDPKAEIMFIGEAPGKKEDETGIPFVGSSGKILDKILESIDIKREEIYLTNICKCRPPKNQDPLPEEVAACWPYLEKQITIIDPKIIVTLGKYALNAFLPEAKISEMHGKIQEIELPKIGRRKIFPSYHPAAARQNRKTRALFNEDFKKIPRILEKIKKG